MPYSMRASVNTLALVTVIVAVNVERAYSAPISADDVKLRDCGFCDTPGQSCCPIITSLNRGTEVTVICRRTGQSIYGNPYWLWVYVPSIDEWGWVTDYYVHCGGVCTGDVC